MDYFLNALVHQTAMSGGGEGHVQGTNFGIYIQAHYLTRPFCFSHSQPSFPQLGQI